MMNDNDLISNMIDNFTEAGINISRTRTGEICFPREDICKRDEKMIQMLKDSDSHLVKQVLETEAPDERQTFKDF
jgi:hypothetical protein